MVLRAGTNVLLQFETLHTLVKIATFCNLRNNNLVVSFSTITVASTILNKYVHKNGGEAVICCQKRLSGYELYSTEHKM